jgi:glutathione S-transferase
MEGQLAQKEYLEGMFSVADISLFMDILFANRLGGPPLDPYPGLKAWYQRVSARPSVAAVAAEIAEADRILS